MQSVLEPVGGECCPWTAAAVPIPWSCGPCHLLCLCVAFVQTEGFLFVFHFCFFQT